MPDCPGCGRSFNAEQYVGVHQSRTGCYPPPLPTAREAWENIVRSPHDPDLRALFSEVLARFDRTVWV